MNNKALGQLGEECAVEYLTRNGYEIIDTNVRPIPGLARGEVDIVAWNDSCLCFVEVKLRKSSTYGPSDVVNVVKRRKLARLAQAYLNRHRLENVDCRFDIVMVTTGNPHSPAHCSLYKDAFRPYDL